MLTSFFFIPTNRPKMLAKLPSIPADVFIFDMEYTIGITEI